MYTNLMKERSEPKFQYKSIVASEFFFNMPSEDTTRIGDLKISTSICISKETSKRKCVGCVISAAVSDEITKEETIKIRTKSRFDIVSDYTNVDFDTLVNAAAGYCVPISLEETDKIILRASEALIGQQINLQLSSRFEEDE